MLLRNNTRIVERAVIDLYFDDNTEKHIEIATGDIVCLTYNDSGYSRRIQGKVVNVVNRRSNKLPPPSYSNTRSLSQYPEPALYPIHGAQNNNSYMGNDGYITIDGSDFYRGNRVNVYFSHILDCDVIEREDDSLIIRTDGVGAINRIRLFRGSLQLSQDNGLTWIDASDFLKESPTKCRPNNYYSHEYRTPQYDQHYETDCYDRPYTTPNPRYPAANDGPYVRKHINTPHQEHGAGGEEWASFDPPPIKPGGPGSASNDWSSFDPPPVPPNRNNYDPYNNNGGTF